MDTLKGKQIMVWTFMGNARMYEALRDYGDRITDHLLLFLPYIQLFLLSIPVLLYPNPSRKVCQSCELMKDSDLPK